MEENQNTEPTYIYINEDDPKNKELKCQYICHEILNEPVSHIKCNHSFCLNCISKVNYKCPLCGSGDKEEFETIKNRIVLNLLNELEILCNNCNVRTTRGIFKDHISICKFKCPLDCGTIINRKTLNLHKNICPNEIIRCSSYDIGCDVEINRYDLDNHIKTCNWVLLKPIIKKLIDKNKQLENKIIYLEQKINELEKNKIEDESGLESNDIVIVMKQSNVSRPDAVKSLKKNNGDLVAAISELTMK